jgi:hypothetical protein
LKSIIMQILHNEAEAYDDLLQEVFFHAIDRYDASCHSSNGFNESHTVSAKHFMMISVRCCISFPTDFSISSDFQRLTHELDNRGVI